MYLKGIKSTHNEENKDSIQEIKRKKLIEKIAISLKLQHNKLFIEKNYQIKNLISDLKEIIKLDDLKICSYDTFYNKIEQIILKIISNKDKQLSKSTDFAKTMSLIPKPKKSTIDSNMNTISKYILKQRHKYRRKEPSNTKSFWNLV